MNRGKSLMGRVKIIPRSSTVESFKRGKSMAKDS